MFGQETGQRDYDKENVDGNYAIINPGPARQRRIHGKRKLN